MDQSPGLVRYSWADLPADLRSEHYQRWFRGAGQRRSAQYVRLRCEPLGRTERGRARHGLDPVVDHHHGHRCHRRGSRRVAHRAAIPIILGANVGTTVTTTLVALTFIGSRTEFRRALGASTIHDFYNWLALLIFFPLELIWHPLERISGALTNALYGTGWLPDPARFNFVRAATRPVEEAVLKATSHLSSTLGPLFTIVIGAALILVAVRYLGKLLKLLMVGRARDILIKAVGRNAYLAMASGMGVTVLTQSSTITTSVLVPFAGAGILTPAQIYPVTVGANLGTTFTVVFAAFAVVGQDAKIGLQAAFVHLLYNLFAIIVIYVIPVLRPVPLFCAQTFARIAAERKWVIAVYLFTVFIALPALVIILVGVL
jgi:solute carrier family 34 (sodium-dependent phosphate cotransporter)